MSQVEFGERCGFYQTYLSRIENGHANPTLNALEVIANALGLTVFELFERVRATGEVPVVTWRRTNLTRIVTLAKGRWRAQSGLL